MAETWQSRFDRLLKAMTQGDPPKRRSQKANPQEGQEPAESDSHAVRPPNNRDR